MDLENIRDTAFQNDEDLYGKSVEAVPVPKKEIGIDLEDSVFTNIINTVETSSMDINALNSFTQVSRSRNDVYDMIDTMADDATMAAVLETYAEDATETNDQGAIMWCESSNADCQKFVTYLLDSFNVDKNIYKWTHSLCKYGDVYLRLYRESDYDDFLFAKPKTDKDDGNKKTKKNKLNEDVVIKGYRKDDNYVHYLEQAYNPAQVFELTRFGKTVAYIKTDVKSVKSATNQLGSTNTIFGQSSYSFNKNDVELFQPTEWVHGCLTDDTSRTPEEVTIFADDKRELTYTVNRGQSLLYNMYKVWRELSLLENSVLLNRVTQSSIVRVIGVEVGDMPKENVQPHLMNIKQLIEQKSALYNGKSMSEYTNPGPIVNNVYVPTRNGKGVISTQQLGGDVNVGDLVDLDYYQTKLFGGLRVPKQYFGLTDDAAGFNGGSSLSIISSRYAKMIKRIQNVMIQMLTDAVNLVLIDTGNQQYINEFTLKMLPPTTQEEVDRRDNLSSKVSLVRDIMDILSDIENTTTKLKILKSLLSDVVTDGDLVALIQNEIDALAAEEEAAEEVDTDAEAVADDNLGLMDSSEPLDLGGDDNFGFADTTATDTSSETSDSPETDLPSPEDLGAGDMSDMSNPELD